MDVPLINIFILHLICYPLLAPFHDRYFLSPGWTDKIILDFEKGVSVEDSKIKKPVARNVIQFLYKKNCDINYI